MTKPNVLQNLHSFGSRRRQKRLRHFDRRFVERPRQPLPRARTRSARLRPLRAAAAKTRQYCPIAAVPKRRRKASSRAAQCTSDSLPNSATSSMSSKPPATSRRRLGVNSHKTRASASRTKLRRAANNLDRVDRHPPNIADPSWVGKTCSIKRAAGFIPAETSIARRTTSRQFGQRCQMTCDSSCGDA